MSLINVQLEPDGPITQMDESELVKTINIIDNEVEHTVETIYHLKSQPNAAWAVHKSVDMQLKKPAVFADGVVAGFF